MNAANAATDALFCEANRQEKMGELYCQYLRYWFDTINGGLFIHYNSVAPCNNTGSWGLKEYTGQPDDLSPKWRALRHCGLVDTEDIPETPSGLFQIYPNPTDGMVQLRSGSIRKGDRVEIFNTLGHLVFSSTEWLPNLDLSAQPPGLYWVVIKHLGKTVWYGKMVKH